jgi:hypothetical protein
MASKERLECKLTSVLLAHDYDEGGAIYPSRCERANGVT